MMSAPHDDPSAEIKDKYFQEISFRYARTTRRKASGRIGEILASRNAIQKVASDRCFVFESLAMILSLCVKKLIRIDT